ncbi:MAG: VWA domain-containing protein [Clostridia bacterium]|nr:VWA domain-containing protein [Clostridia bacterium]
MAQIDFNVLANQEDISVRNDVQDIIAGSGGTRIDCVSEPHVACCLLVDTSGSMSGSKIDELNKALRDFGPIVCEDPLSAKRVDVCVIEFNTDVNVVTPFCPIRQFNPPTLKAGGGTQMATAIRYALEAVHEQVHKYHEAGVECYKPFVLMITDGEPTESVAGIEKMIAAREGSGRYGRLRFHAFGVKGANMDLLSKLTHRTLAISNDAFGEIFNWASKSMQAISHSTPAENVAGADITANMHAYDPVTKKLPWDD